MYLRGGGQRTAHVEVGDGDDVVHVQVVLQPEPLLVPAARGTVIRTDKAQPEQPPVPPRDGLVASSGWPPLLGSRPRTFRRERWR